MTDQETDQVIDRLDASLQRAGLPGLRPPASDAPLRAAVDAVAPLRLPADLVRFWMRVDPTSVAVESWPGLIGPAFGLESWRAMHDPEFAPTPVLLFPIACSSHDFLLLELGGGWGPGGTIFAWANDDEPLWSMRHRGIADLLDVWADLIDDGAFERGPSGRAVVDEAVEEERWTARLAAAGPHPLHGAAVEVGSDPRGWPTHWRASAGPLG